MTRMLQLNRRWLALGLAAVETALLSAVAFAQSTPDVDVAVKTTRTTSVWYGEWWIWAAAVAVFLIVIVALTSRGRSA